MTATFKKRKNFGAVFLLDWHDVVQFLDKNPKFLDTYVAKRIPIRRFISWGEEKVKQCDEGMGDFVANFLLQNPKFLEKHVVTHVKVDSLKEWLVKKGDSGKFDDKCYLPDGRPRSPPCAADQVDKALVFGEKDLARGFIKRILEYAKDIVQSERTSLYIFDEENNELVSEYYQYDEQLFPYGFEIRQPATAGIAGATFLCKQSVIIPDCYKDPRYNKEIDSKTGYITRNMLLHPIVISNEVVMGVLEARNSIGPSHKHFTLADQRSLNLINEYVTVAIKLGKVSLSIQNKEDRLHTTMKILYGHNVYRQKDYQQLLKDPGIHVIPQNFEKLSFNYLEYSEYELVRNFIYMLNDLFGKDEFDHKRLCSFILTVNSNYRRVTYHNFHHAFNVAHCIYIILKSHPNVFTDLESKALMAAAICHDVNHMGVNNSYLTLTRSALSSLYPQSTLERHHYQIAVSIIQQDKNNIFYDLKNEEFIEVLDLMQHAIISTDLANYGCNRTSLMSIISDNLDLRSKKHREAVISLMMVGADLSASCKPWKVQLRSVHELYEEFYKQGDLEKERGLEPISMMNREAIADIPKDQVNFITFLCMPCYTLLVQILPIVSYMVEQLKQNLDLWKNLVEEGEKAKHKAEH